MNLKIESVAVFPAGRCFFLPELEPLCGKKIGILSNGFLFRKLAAFAEELIGGEGSCVREVGVCYYLLLWFIPL
jgi:hypothetical protein